MPARAVGADEGVLGHVLALAPGGDVAPDQGRYPVLVLAHQQVERGAVAALHATDQFLVQVLSLLCVHDFGHRAGAPWGPRSEEHTSELQSLMRISYAVFCLKKKKKKNTKSTVNNNRT